MGEITFEETGYNVNMKRKINIVVPMAGLGSRFQNVGFENPKPLIDVLGEPMISLVVRNLTPTVPHRFIFICQWEHDEKYAIKKHLEMIAPGCVVKLLSDVTDGAACTVLEASDMLDHDQPLIIANCDQYVKTSMDEYINSWGRSGNQGYIMTMKASEDKWSYVRLNQSNLVLDVVEKIVVSDEATVGIYNFEKASDFITAANSMIQRDIRVKGEFYVAPVYNLLIEDGYEVGIHNIGECDSTMYGLGTPEDLSEYIRQFRNNH